MQFLNKIVITLTILISLVSFSQAETNWITKKTKKEKKIEKVEKKETESSWIKKKKEKNKKKFKEKKKESKSWITTKTKKEKKIEKKILKEYLEIADLPEANFYFSAKSDNGQIVYGYVNADKKSDLLELNGTSYFSLSNGYAYLDDGKTTCTVHSQLGTLFGSLAGKVVVECRNKLEFIGNFVQQLDVGIGSGQTNKGDIVNFKFTQLKNKNLAYFKGYKKIRLSGLPPDNEEDIIIKPSGKYYALLIGNSDYSKSKWASLKSPVNDVVEIAKVLKSKYDFKDVIVKKNVERHEIFRELKNLRKIVTPNDYLLIYYSGHGEEDTQQAYWIPVNAEKEWDENWIDTITITAAIQRIQTKHTLLMIDSCYIGTAFKGNNDNKINSEYASRNAKIVKKALDNRAGIVISSGSTTSVLDTAVDNKHSLFAYKFIDILKKNKSFVTSTKIFVELSDYHAGFKQTPQRYFVSNWGHLDGDFVFIPKK